MSLTYSEMLPIGSKMPLFNLLNVVNGKNFSDNNLSLDFGTVVMIICNHCPYVIHYHNEIVSLVSKYSNKGIQFVAISSNDIINYPQDSPENMKNLFLRLNLKIPYLYDENQEVAKLFKAACTPEFYLFNNGKKLIYRGRLDSSSPGNNLPINGKDLRDAINSYISGEMISDEQFPSMGCNIKWK